MLFTAYCVPGTLKGMWNRVMNIFPDYKEISLIGEMVVRCWRYLPSEDVECLERHSRDGVSELKYKGEYGFSWNKRKWKSVLRREMERMFQAEIRTGLKALAPLRVSRRLDWQEPREVREVAGGGKGQNCQVSWALWVIVWPQGAYPECNRKPRQGWKQCRDTIWHDLIWLMLLKDLYFQEK